MRSENTESRLDFHYFLSVQYFDQSASQIWLHDVLCVFASPTSTNWNANQSGDHELTRCHLCQRLMFQLCRTNMWCVNQGFLCCFLECGRWVWWCTDLHYHQNIYWTSYFRQILIYLLWLILCLQSRHICWFIAHGEDHAWSKWT